MRHNKLAMLTGQRFGVMLVIAYAGESKWLCFCECRSTHIVAARDLKRRAYAKCSTVKHIPAELRALRSIYRHAKERCTNPSNSHYPTYGARGIQFRFTSIEDFFSEIGPRPSLSHSVDRINNDGHYEVGNIHWATPLQQAQNMRTNRWIELDGVKRTLSEWARLSPVLLSTIHARLTVGCCARCSIFNPPHTKCSHRNLVSPARHSNSETGKGDEIVKNLSASTA